MRITYRNLLHGLLISGLILFSGCQLSQSLAPSRIDSTPEIIESQPGALKKYDAFYVPEIEVYSIEGDVFMRVNPREVKDLAESFRSKLIHQLDSKYTMFPQPAKNVAGIKIAISDVSSTYSLFQLLPGAVVQNAMRGGASIEAKVVDSITGKEVLTFKDTKQGQRQGYFSGLTKWDGVERAFDEWAMQLDQAIKK